MRTIHTDEITKCIKEMCMQVNVDLSPDVKDALLAGKEKEESPIGKQILEQLEKNLEIAKESQIPICQDTGMTVVFLRIGQEVHIEGDFLEAAVNEGIRQGYAEGYLRKSVVSDPILRENTKDMTVFIVSQRATTIRNADTILVLDDGKLAGIGNHKQLLKECDVYREICLSQLSKEEVERDEQ